MPHHHTVACRYAAKFSDKPAGRTSKLVYFDAKTHKVLNKQNNGFMNVETKGKHLDFNTLSQMKKATIFSVDYSSFGSDPQYAIENNIITPAETAFAEARRRVIQNKVIGSPDIDNLAKYYALLGVYNPYMREDMRRLSEPFLTGSEDFFKVAHLNSVNQVYDHMRFQIGKWSLLYIPTKFQNKWRVVLPDVGTISPGAPFQILPLDRDHLVIAQNNVRLPDYAPVSEWALRVANRISMEVSHEWYACGGHNVLYDETG